MYEKNGKVKYIFLSWMKIVSALFDLYKETKNSGDFGDMIVKSINLYIPENKCVAFFVPGETVGE